MEGRSPSLTGCHVLYGVWSEGTGGMPFYPSVSSCVVTNGTYVCLYFNHLDMIIIPGYTCILNKTRNSAHCQRRQSKIQWGLKRTLWGILILGQTRGTPETSLRELFDRNKRRRIYPPRNSHGIRCIGVSGKSQISPFPDRCICRCRCPISEPSPSPSP